MKKIIALFIILGAHALNGMEPLDPAPPLPPEITAMIVAYVHAYNNSDDVVKALQKLSVLDAHFNTIINDMYGNPAGFKFLVHKIAKKFNKQPWDIASTFNTPAARRYINLCTELRNKLKAQDIEGVKQLLEQGADINGFPTLVAVMTATKMPKLEMIQLLLNQGANPYATTLRGVPALKIFNDMHRYSHEYWQIKTLLEEAMEKQAQ